MYGVMWTRLIALTLLVAASVLTAWGVGGLTFWPTVGYLFGICGIACVGLFGHGRTPFVAAFAIVFVNVGLLVALT